MKATKQRITLGWNEPITGRNPESLTIVTYGLVEGNPGRLWIEFEAELGLRPTRSYIMLDSLDYYTVKEVIE